MSAPGLAAFVLARQDEKEAVARFSLRLYGRGSSLYIANHDPELILREVDAVRAIVALHHTSETPPRMAEIGVSYVGRDPSCSSRDYIEESDDCETLLTLAAIHADHPDYDPRWKL